VGTFGDELGVKGTLASMLYQFCEIRVFIVAVSGNIFGTHVGLNVKLLLHYFGSVLSTDP
jgi:hypothetical protein